MSEPQVDTASDTPSTPSPATELSNLDLLRAFAVLAVVADHFVTMVATRVGAVVTPFVWHVGRVGVLVFFVHTSLVLMQSLARTPLSGWRLFTHFYTRRVFRIYPLSTLCTVVVLAFAVPRVPWELPTAWTRTEIVSSLLLVNNLTHTEAVVGPLWSLPYELQMYVLLPCLFLLARRMPFLGWAIGLFVASVIVGVVQPMVPGASRLDLARYGPCFVAGVVAYVGLLRVSPRLPGWTWPIAVLGLMSAYVAASLATGIVHSTWISWVFCGAVGLLIPTVRQVTSPLLVRTAHVIARYSYGVYLFHVIGVWLAFAAVPQSVVVATGLGLLMTAAMAVFTYHAIEKPGIALGGRVARRLVAGRPARPAGRRPGQVPVGSSLSEA
jgi:peptidoglycan/LPS O-acetylase OafA/YrhL